jgi:RNA polymerase sigma-70 factor (ECF subfamily)
MDGAVAMQRRASWRNIAYGISARSVTMTIDDSDEFDAARLIDAVARSHDRAAFVALFGYYAPRLKAYLVRCGVTTDLAEELVQEALLTVWRKAPLFDPVRASASAWIFTIVRNLRIDRLRRDRFVLDDSLLREEVDPQPPADHRIDRTRRHHRLHAALATLSPEQTEVLRLSFFDDRPHAEIERALGIPLGTVKSRLRLAVGKLRKLLEGDE